MKKLILAAVLAATPVLGFAAPVYADSPGQLSNAPTNYEVKNVTRGGSYSQSTTATCNETVKYSVLLANSDFGLLRNLTVKANLASGAISASATNTVNATTSVSGNVTVNVTQGNLAYVPGSTVRITSNGQNRTTLPDGITGAGVNAGELAGSTQTFVQFEAKVNCDTPQPGKINVCDLTSKKVVTINENEFDAAKHSKDLSKCDVPAAPQVLAATGPVETLAQIVGVTALAGAISYYIASRRQNTLG